MLAEEKKGKLKKFLTALGDNELRALTRAIEYGRSISIEDIPSDDILELIRPALADLQPEHLPKLPRVLCEPCEDFFISFPPDVKRPGQVPRSIIGTFTEMTRQLLGQTADNREQEMIAAFVAGDWSSLNDLKMQFWTDVAEVWDTRFEKGVDEELRKSLGGSDGVENLKEAVQCVAEVEQILMVRESMAAKPVVKLSSKQMEELASTLEEANQNLKSSGVVLWTIFRRLTKASSIFALFSRLDRSKAAWGKGHSEARETIEQAFLTENDDRAKDLISALKGHKISADHIFSELDSYLDEAEHAKSGCSASNKVAAKEQTTARIRSLSTLVEKQVLKSVNPSVSAAVGALTNMLASPEREPEELETMIKQAEYAAKAFSKSRRVIDSIGVRTSYETARKDLTKTLQVTEDRMKHWVDEVHKRNEEPSLEYILYFCRIVEMVLGPGPARNAQMRLTSSGQRSVAA